MNKSNAVIVLSFLMSTVLIWLIYKNLGFYPYGEKTVLLMDMKGQYSEFLAYLRHIATGDNSFFYSWSRSMGGNFIGLFSYYIASPLSWLTVLFSLSNLPVAIFWLTVIKIGLCGLSFAVYAEHALNNRKGNPIVVIFAVCYALMSYNMVYSICVMWLDGVILLPIVLLGIEKILNGKKGLVYLVSITSLFIINYYTAYMVGIFSGLYIIYRVFSLADKDNIKKYLIYVRRFAGNTILAVGLAAPFLLPTVKDLAVGKLSQQGYNPNLMFNFEFQDIFTKLLPGNYDSITNSGLPAIYSGMMVLILAAVFLIRKQISRKEKAGAVVILSLMFTSFWIGKLDVAWHGFQYPNWFPYRYAFLLSFLLIYMAYRASLTLKIEKSWKKAVFIIVLSFTAMDMYQNATAMITGLDKEFQYGEKSEYDDFYKKTMPLVTDIKKRDDGFYRMDKNYEYSKNDAMLFGYNGMTHYSSTYNASVNQFTRKLGIAQAHLWNSNYGSTPITDSIFSVKYLLYDKELPDAYAPIGNNSGIVAYENKNVLPIAFSANIPKESLALEDGNPFTNQNRLLNTLASTQESYYIPVNFTKRTNQDGWSYTFTADSDHPVYLFMRGNQIGHADVLVNGIRVGSYFTNETNCNLYLGQFKKGMPVTVECQGYGIQAYEEYLYELDMDSYTRTMDRLDIGGLEVSRHKNGKITGTIVVGMGKKIFTSIPYDKGLVVKVDGVKVETEKFEDTFLVIPAEPGEHKISIRYSCPGFFGGIMIAVIAAFLAILYFRKECDIKRNRYSKDCLVE